MLSATHEVKLNLGERSFLLTYLSTIPALLSKLTILNRVLIVKPSLQEDDRLSEEGC